MCYHRGMGKKDKDKKQNQARPPLLPKPGPSGIPPAPQRVVKRGL